MYIMQIDYCWPPIERPTAGVWVRWQCVALTDWLSLLVYTLVESTSVAYLVE